MTRRFDLLLHALGAARPVQLRARALRPLRRRRFPRARPAPALAPPTGPLALWRSAAFDVEPTRVPEDWSGAGLTRLQQFHLHYGAEVLSAARREDTEHASFALRSWIEGNPPRRSDAWHPYPLSTRVGNWVAALALAPDLATPAVAASLDLQVRYLARNLEWDILGNHLVRNLRGLALGALALGQHATVERALTLLREQLRDQILADGGHVERSPVYHVIVLRDLLEIRDACDAAWLAEPVERMRRFAAALTRPDGRPAPFNDAPLELAPALDLPRAGETLNVLRDSGYVVARKADAWIAFDCGVPGPDYLPAHSHADALSFQLWVGGRPIVVDPGTFTYEAGQDRDWFRGTRSHSTVAVDSRDQFRLWGAFRSGRLPKVELLGSGPDGAQASVVHSTTTTRHTRSLDWSGDSLLVSDLVEGRGRHLVESTLPLADGGDVQGTGAELVEERGWVSERFGERSPVRLLRLRGEFELPVRLSWEIPLRAAAPT
ncbi:MAG TPA: heparinase II/III family protein [Gaiellaceae bacterium]|nr:heparinase II/III family protein [Gaiellaceae bacterium]